MRAGEPAIATAGISTDQVAAQLLLHPAQVVDPDAAVQRRLDETIELRAMPT